MSNDSYLYYLALGHAINNERPVVGTERVEINDFTITQNDFMFRVPKEIFNVVSTKIEQGFNFSIINGDVIETGRDINILKRNAINFITSVYNKYSNTIIIEDCAFILTVDEVALLSIATTIQKNFTIVRNGNVYTLPKSSLFRIVSDFMDNKEKLNKVYSVCSTKIDKLPSVSSSEDILFIVNSEFKAYVEKMYNIKIEQELL